MGKKIFFGLVFVVLLLSISSVSAGTCPNGVGTNCFYVTPFGSGAANGANWANAYAGLPRDGLESANSWTTYTTNLTRGATYYVAAGNYPFYSFDDPISGTQWIRIVKATTSNSGNVAGWQSSYAGQATFSSMYFRQKYYDFDGQTRNENNWRDSSSYGFAIAGTVTAFPDNYAPGGEDLRFKYFDIGQGTGTAHAGTAFYLVGSKNDALFPLSGFYLGYSHVHNVAYFMLTKGYSDGLIENNYIGPSWGKEVMRGQGDTHNWTIRNNRFVDGCQPENGNTCTGDIAAFQYGDANNWNIYGNVFQNTISMPRNQVIKGGGGQPGGYSYSDNWNVYNNIFVGINGGSANVIIDGQNNKAYNNLWYNVGSATGAVVEGDCSGCSLDTSNNLINPANNPFVNYAGGNFNLVSGSSAINGGKNLAGVSGFSNVDANGNIRGADGFWDIGAFEFNGVVAQINGSCGSSNNVCNSGALNDILDNPTTYLWQCVGQGGGTTASCSQIIPATNGQCGSSVNSCISPASATSISSNATANLWICPGSNGGSNAQCFITVGANKFNIGDRVYVSDPTPLVIRSTAGGTNIGSQNPNALGTIAAGPTTASVGGTPYVWWNVTFDVAPSGWTIEGFLEEYTSPVLYHPADTNNNLILTSSEVSAYVNGYFTGSTSLTQVLYALTLLQSGGSYASIGTSNCVSTPWSCFSSS